MHDVITVCINDKDNYFRLGLEHCLIGYFSRRDICFSLNDSEDSGQADLVFSSMPDTMKNHCSHITEAPEETTRILFFIGETSSKKIIRARCGWHYAGALSRRASRSVIDVMLDKALEQRWGIERCPACAAPFLSAREKQVLSYLSKGLSQAQIADRLRVSVKTVHSHKRSVMKKMALKSKHEFLYWLIRR